MPDRTPGFYWVRTRNDGWMPALWTHEWEVLGSEVTIDDDSAFVEIGAHIERQPDAAVAAERDRCMKLAEECGAFGISSRIQRGAGVIDANGTAARIERTSVLAEREACAKIAEQATAEAHAIMDGFLATDDSWQYALNEMSEAVNEGFNVALQKWRDVAVKIRARGK